MSIASSRARPTPRAGEVLVDVRAAGVNHIDANAVRDGYAANVYASGSGSGDGGGSWVPGREFSGVVAEVGPGVRGLEVGDEVYGATPPTSRDGAFAEFTATPAHAVALKPEGLAHEDAAAIPFAALTAYRALFDKGRLRANERVLIMGGGSAVGTSACALAVDLGCDVTATSSEMDIDRLKNMGVSDVVDYKVKAALKRTTGSDGWAPFDLALNCVGSKRTETQAIDRLKYGTGRYVSLHGDLGKFISHEKGMLAGVMKAFQEYTRKKAVTRFQRDVGYEQAVMRLDPDGMLDIARLVESGALRVPVGKVLGLEEIETAFDLLRDGSVAGKIVIKM